MGRTNLDCETREIQGKVAVDQFDKHWDPISGRYYDSVNAGDYQHRVFTGAVTGGTDGATVSLGNFTTGARDETVIDFEAFIGSTGSAIGTNVAPIGYVQIDQAGTILRQFLLDDSIPASGGGSNPLRRVHFTAPNQLSPVMVHQGGSNVVNIKWVSLGTVSATIHVNWASNRVGYKSASVPVGSVI